MLKNAENSRVLERCFWLVVVFWFYVDANRFPIEPCVCNWLGVLIANHLSLLREESKKVLVNVWTTWKVTVTDNCLANQQFFLWSFCLWGGIKAAQRNGGNTTARDDQQLFRTIKISSLLSSRRSQPTIFRLSKAFHNNCWIRTGLIRRESSEFRGLKSLFFGCGRFGSLRNWIPHYGAKRDRFANTLSIYSKTNLESNPNKYLYI